MKRVLHASMYATVSALATLLLAGCSTAVTATLTPPAGLTGKAFGGQQPISAATIQIYAVSTNGSSDGTSATALLTVPVTTSDGTGVNNANANVANSYNTLPAGFFNVSSGSYTCPSASTQVYLTASAGNPGISVSTNNTAIQLMVPLGSCGSLANQSSVSINEVTTVGAVAALYPFMTDFNAVGSTASDASALVSAFTTAAEYINLNTGLAPGPSLPSGLYASTNELNALANSVAACVNTAGYTPGDNSSCDKLFSYATPQSTGIAPTNTVAALLGIRQNPTQNVASIFNLATAVGPFAPTVTAAPVDWTLPILTQPGAPTFSPAAGTYTAIQTVTLADSDSNAVIYYTTDGSTPTSSSSVYSSALTVSASQTLRAIAIESGRVSGATASATYTLNLPADLPLLHTNGQSIVNANGTVALKGVNLGGWYVMESYMSPTDSAGTYPDEFSILTELSSRFGEAQAEAAVNTYIQNWITTSDIATIAKAGFNTVRIPIWWGQFYKLGAYPTTGDPSAYLRSDAFTYLDTIIGACAQNNVYVILDMHGAFGGQTGNADTGHAGDNTYFSNANNQTATVAMWKMIAAHYQTSPFKGTIAAFDLLNEPTGILGSGTSGGITQAQLVAQYNSIYTAIRQADPARMIIMESCYWTSNAWAYSNLPNPTNNSYGYTWNNVVYSTHVYPGSSDTAAQIEAAADKQKTNYAAISAYNVPVYVGEFQAYNTGVSTWQYVESDFDGAGIGWSFWAYKANNGKAPNYWGWYDPTTFAVKPNIGTDSLAVIQADWTNVKTSSIFAENPALPTSAY